MSTFPPTQCGLATFTASLASALRDGNASADVGIVRVVERAEAISRPEVVHQLVTSVEGGEAAAAEVLDQFGVAIIQHEYGIYGGPDGDSVITVMRRLRVPAIVVLHTVLVTPTVNQRRVLEQVVAAAAAVVVMTETAKRRLFDGYRVDASKVVLIPHGAPGDWALSQTPPPAHAPTALTWGLLGPGKGIEWAIAAVAKLQDQGISLRYVIAGETHPNVLEHAGESYREMLKNRAADLGVGHLVRFENRYLDPISLRELVSGADVVVLPYDSTDQVTSGVLIEAVAARRPVVATAFPHAVELLSSGAGTIVAHRDPGAIADAVRRILEEPGLAASMVAVAGRLRADLTWAAVAGRYRQLAQRVQRELTSVVA